MIPDKKVILFIVYTLALCVGWFILYDIWLNTFDEWLALKIAEISTACLGFIGYNAETSRSIIFIDDKNLVYIGPACNGMILMALFAGFIIAFPGPLVKKIIYIPLGILIITVLNILRVVALSLNALYSHNTLDFNHKYTFTIIVYAFIFALWMIWVKRFSPLKDYAFSNPSKR